MDGITINQLEKIISEEPENNNEPDVVEIKDYESQIGNQFLGNSENDFIQQINQQEDNEEEKNYRQKLIDQIEKFELINTNSKKMKYPASCGNYKYGDNLRELGTDELKQIIKLQNSSSSFEKFARVATIMTLQGCALVENYISDLNGFTGSASKSMVDIEECFKEILLEYSDEMEGIMGPETRLLMILGSAAIVTYSTNKAKKTNNSENNNLNCNNNITSTNNNDINIPNVQPVKRGRGRPRKYV